MRKTVSVNPYILYYTMKKQLFQGAIIYIKYALMCEIDYELQQFSLPSADRSGK